jgi:hypothetical protein
VPDYADRFVKQISARVLREDLLTQIDLRLQAATHLCSLELMEQLTEKPESLGPARTVTKADARTDLDVGNAVLRTTCEFLAKLILLEGFPIKYVQDLVAWCLVREGKRTGFSDEKLAELVDWSRQNVTFHKRKTELGSTADMVNLQSSLLAILITRSALGAGALFDEARRCNIGAQRKERVDREKGSVSMQTLQVALESLAKRGEVRKNDDGTFEAVQDWANLLPLSLGEHQRRVMSKTNNELIAALGSLESLPSPANKYSRQIGHNGSTVSQSRDVISIKGSAHEINEMIEKIAQLTSCRYARAWRRDSDHCSAHGDLGQSSC